MLNQDTYMFTLHEVKVLFIGNYRHSKGSNSHWVTAHRTMNCINTSTQTCRLLLHTSTEAFAPNRNNSIKTLDKQIHVKHTKPTDRALAAQYFLRGPKHWCKKAPGPVCTASATTITIHHFVTSAVRCGTARLRLSSILRCSCASHPSRKLGLSNTLPGPIAGMPSQQSSLPRGRCTEFPTDTNTSTHAVNARLCTSLYIKAVYNTKCRVTAAVCTLNLEHPS
jgi:hypothetical protein